MPGQHFLTHPMLTEDFYYMYLSRGGPKRLSMPAAVLVNTIV